MSRGKLAGITIGCVIAITVVMVLVIPHLLTTYTLSVGVDPPGAGSVYPSGGKYKPGMQVAVLAMPDSGYSFSHWDGGASGATRNITITMDSDKDITAHFETEVSPPVDTYTLTIAVSPSGAGSVSPSSGDYEAGAEVRLMASAASGYTFDHWSGAASGAKPGITITMDSDKSVTANFRTITYALTTNVSPSGGGSVSPSGGEYYSGVQVTLIASPASGYAFDHWGGGASGNTSKITVTMDSDKDITAYFRTGVSPPGTYTLTTYVSPSGAGSVSPQGGQYASGVQVTLTATPASGYTFDHWGGSASGTTPSITITMNSDKSLTAYFKTTAPGLLFSDDFGNDNGVWDTFYNADGSVSYENGWLHLINTTLAPLPTVTCAGQHFADLILEVQTELVEGTIDNWHSVGCRYQDDGNYYEFSISADGYYCIAKWVDGESIYLLGAAQSSYVNTGVGAVNLIRVECIGTRLSLSVNGHLLGEVTDTTYSGGDIALAASGLSGSPYYTEIAFDNIVVSEP
jgi:uncharacterized repeat protein (TIGR02543 family)